MHFLLTDTLLHNNINIVDDVIVKTVEAAPNGIRWDTIVSLCLNAILAFVAYMSYRRSCNIDKKAKKDRNEANEKMYQATRRSTVYQMLSTLESMTRYLDAIEDHDNHNTSNFQDIVNKSFEYFNHESSRLKVMVGTLTDLSDTEIELAQKAILQMDEFNNNLPNDVNSAKQSKLKFSAIITEILNLNSSKNQ